MSTDLKTKPQTFASLRKELEAKLKAGEINDSRYLELSTALALQEADATVAKVASKVAKEAKQPKQPTQSQLEAKEKRAEKVSKRVTLLNYYVKMQREIERANFELGKIPQEYRPHLTGIKTDGIGMKKSVDKSIMLALANLEFDGVCILRDGTLIEFEQGQQSTLIARLSKESGAGITAKPRRELNLQKDLDYANYLAPGCVFLNRNGEGHIHIGRYINERVAFSSLSEAQQARVLSLGKKQGYAEEEASPAPVVISEAQAVATVPNNIIICGENSELNALVSQAISQKFAA